MDKFEGPMSLRTALAKSKNMVSIRVLQDITPKYAQDYVQRFGFDRRQAPARYRRSRSAPDSVTPLQMARAYGVFANGGYLVEPYFILRVATTAAIRSGRRARAPPATKRCGCSTRATPSS
ncbi:MAG: penicillin-binding transpeptidase domain-containing protein [Burkholderiales bacterium]|nr:penicillin-binding transpeptidase domain-containing protein [Burkholderiales bacterium]